MSENDCRRCAETIKPHDDLFPGCPSCRPCAECDGYGVVECECSCGAQALVEHGCPSCGGSGVSHTKGETR